MTRRRIAGIVITALAVGIITTTAAARPIDPLLGRAVRRSSVDCAKLGASGIQRGQATGAGEPRAAERSLQHCRRRHYAAVTPPTASTPGNGFEWGDAAIGAAAATVITLMIGAATLAARQRSQPRLP